MMGIFFIIPGGNIQASNQKGVLLSESKFLQRFCLFFVRIQVRCVPNSVETGEIYGLNI